MAFTAKDWRDFPDTATPVTAAALEDLENRIASYAENYTESTGPYVNIVTQYGADPSGAVDCASVVNQAITDLNAAGGGTVYFPPGLFQYGSTLIMKSNVNLQGSGQFTTTLKTLGTLTSTHLAIKSDQFGTAVINNVLIRDICFDFNRAARDVLDGTGGNFEFRGVTQSTLSSNIHVRDCRIINVKGLGLSFQKCQDCSVRNCTFDNIFRDAIHLNNNCHKFFISNNTLTNVGDDFIVMHSGNTSGDSSSQAVIQGNILRSSVGPYGSMIALNGVNRATVVGNVTYDSYTSALNISCEQASPCRRITVVGNVFQDAGLNNAGQGDGINIFNRLSTGSYYTDPAQAIVEDITISNNVIANPKRYGVWAAGQSTTTPLRYIKFANNTFSTVGDDVFRLEDAIVSWDISGNTIRETQNQVIDNIGTTSSNLQFTNNRITNTNKGTPGAVLGLAAMAGGTISGNRADDTQSTQTMTSFVNWGFSSKLLVTDNNLNGMGGSFPAPSQPNTFIKKYSNITNTGDLEDGQIYINAKAEFGATGDGTTDDRGAIQAAINACDAAPRGGVVWLPPGEYIIGSPGIVWPSTTTKGIGLHGAYRGGPTASTQPTRLKPSGANYPVLEIASNVSGTQLSGANLRNFTIHGNNLGGAPAVKLLRVAHMHISGVRIMNRPHHAIHAQLFWNSHIDNLFTASCGVASANAAVLFTHSGDGSNSGTHTVLMNQCEFESNAWHDLELNGTTGSTCTGVVVTNSKHERGAGNFIRFALAQQCSVIGSFMYNNGASQTVAHAGGSCNNLIGVNFDGLSSSTFDYHVNAFGGSVFSISGCTFQGATTGHIILGTSMGECNIVGNSHSSAVSGGGGTSKVVDNRTTKVGLITAGGQLRAADGVAIKSKAGVPVDGDFASTPSSSLATLVWDNTNNQLYVRKPNGTYVKTAALT